MMAGSIRNRASQTIVKVCPICGVKFIPQHNIRQRYCTKTCYRNFRKTSYLLDGLDNEARQLIRTALLSGANSKCQRCGTPLNGKFHVHHKLSYLDGGRDELDNLLVLCVSCHGKEHTAAKNSLAS